MIYFIADLHFFHENMIKRKNRPFQNAAQMNRKLIQNWNQYVRPNDEIYILGDLSWGGEEETRALLQQLQGKKYLILGNHDRMFLQNEKWQDIFVWMKHYYELSYEGHKFVLFHYPIEEWNGYFKGYFHLHGHQHNGEEENYQNIERGYLRFDVGVDANAMSPVSVEDILDLFD